MKKTLQSQHLRPDQQLADVCQAKLTAINLYMLRCRQQNLSEVTLNYTFQLPICGENKMSVLLLKPLASLLFLLLCSKAMEL